MAHQINVLQSVINTKQSFNKSGSYTGTFFNLHQLQASQK